MIEKKRKAKGDKRILKDVEEPGGTKNGNVIDLMAALKKVYERGGKAKAKPRKAPCLRLIPKNVCKTNIPTSALENPGAG